VRATSALYLLNGSDWESHQAASGRGCAITAVFDPRREQETGAAVYARIAVISGCTPRIWIIRF
jgi:hypothetical protein